MAYQNAFTLGACALRVYKGYETVFPEIGYALVDPGDYAAEGVSISETGGVVTVDLAQGSTASLVLAVAPGYIVGNAPVQINLDSGVNVEDISFRAIKASDFSSLIYNQSSLVLSGTTYQMIGVSTFSYPTVSPNPAELTDVIDWNEVGYFFNNDGPMTTSYTFSVEIDDASLGGSCFWQDVIAATQNCNPV